jgi:hypothetical protein
MPSESNDAGPSRRAFLVRFAGAAFAAPVIASFALDGVAQASERGGHQKDKRHCAPNQGHPNQTNPNQTNPNQGPPKHGHPNQGYPNQTNPNQGPPNHGHPKQCHPNQGNPNQTLPDSSSIG